MAEIRLKYIPAIFPVFDYTDKKKVVCRVVGDPEDFSKIVMTDKEYKTIDYQLATIKLKAQSLVYKKYFFQIEIKEKVDLQLLRLADEVTIIDDYDIERSINAYNIELQQNKIANSENYTYTVSFLELKNDDQSISNYLCNDFLLQKYTTNELWKLSISNSKNIDDNFYFISGKYTDILTIAQWDEYSSGHYSITLPLVYPLTKLTIGDTVTISYNPSIGYLGTTLTVTNIYNNLIEFITTGYTGSDLTGNEITLNWDYSSPDSLDYYSRIVPFQNVKLLTKEEKNDVNSSPIPILKYATKSKVLSIPFYLSLDDSIDFDWYIDLCDSIVISCGSTSYNVLYAEVDYSKDETELIGIVKRDLKLYVETLNYYKFAP